MAILSLIQFFIAKIKLSFSFKELIWYLFLNHAGELHVII